MRTAMLLLAALSACNPQSWRDQDTFMEEGVLAVTIVDWYQTVGIVAACREANPIIGECGERVNLHVYFFTVLLAQAVVARLLPPHYRTVLQGALLGAETATIWDNWRSE